MKIRIAALGATLLFLVVVAACQQPAETTVPAGSDVPLPGRASPVAPAIEPGQPSPEQPIELPASPIAPAIEPGFVTPEPMLSFDPG
jgi:hypothetical protein